MTYQYYCPCSQRNLLQGDEQYAGQQVQCPLCQQLFTQPPPTGGQQPSAPGAGDLLQQATQGGGYGAAQGSSLGQAPGTSSSLQGGFSPPAYGQQPSGPDPYAADPYAADPYAADPYAAGLPSGDPFGPANPMGPQVEETFHLVCPQCKQVMPTPQSMLGQDAQCPFCQSVITLFEEDTLEYQRRREEYLRQKEERIGRKALNWAIAAAILVGVALLVMVVLYISNQ